MGPLGSRLLDHAKAEGNCRKMIISLDRRDGVALGTLVGIALLVGVAVVAVNSVGGSHARRPVAVATVYSTSGTDAEGQDGASPEEMSIQGPAPGAQQVFSNLLRTACGIDPSWILWNTYSASRGGDGGAYLTVSYEHGGALAIAGARDFVVTYCN
jgi:hypothetical protein